MNGWTWIGLLCLAAAASGCRATLAPWGVSEGDLPTSPRAERTALQTTSPAAAAPFLAAPAVYEPSASESSREILVAAQAAQPRSPTIFAAPEPALDLAIVRPAPEPEPLEAGVPVRPITLQQVTESVYVAYPGLEALRRELDIAAGQELSAWGEFDLKARAESLSEPMGFYKNYRNLVRLERALFPGGHAFGQYRIGDGDFPIWYGERETNEGGEFKVGLLTPLLRDRAIDQRRADIFQATLRRQQVDPLVHAQLLELTYLAADAYWTWVAAGLGLAAQRELLQVTIERNRVYAERVRQQDLAPIELVQNERLIATREAKLIEAERKLQQAAIKLSLFLRDELGQPIVPTPAQLPGGFPEPQPPDSHSLWSDIALALTERPELRELDLLREQARVDLASGRNRLWPALDAVVEASKDVGAPASKSNDKTPFELQAGVLFDMPLERRKAEGKIREAEGKLAQVAAKRRFAENKIVAEVQDALSARAANYERVDRARDSHRLAQQLEQAERDRFEAQDSDLLRVALQEAAEIEAALLVIDTLADFFKAEAAYRAALAVDPLAGLD